MNKYTCLLMLLCWHLPSSAQKVWPHLNLVKGNSYNSTIKTEGAIKQTINGLPLQIGVVINSKNRFTVTGVRDTLYDVTMKYDSLNLKMDLPQGSFIFNADHAQPTDVMSVTLSKIKNRDTKLVISKTGRVTVTDTTDAFITDAVNSFDASDTIQKEQTLMQLKQLFGEKQLKTDLELFMCIYPSQQINRNQRWEIDNYTNGKIKAFTHALYSIKDITPTVYTLQSTAITSTVNDTTAQLNGMPIKYNMAGRLNGVFTVDKKTGWVAKAHVTHDMQGHAEIKDNPQLPGGIMIPMYITDSLTINN